MRYALLFPLFIFLFCNQTKAQNLIADSGFEIFNEGCTGHPALEHWFSPSTATPDLWSLEECDGHLTAATMSQYGLPLPFEGQSYVGMFCCYLPTSNEQTRDYVSTELLEVLQAGVSYRVSYQLTRRVNRDLAIDSFGIYFSEEAPFYDFTTIIPVEPQLETSGTILTPDLEWMLIEHTYTAVGGERFLTIGNFRHPDDMLWIDLNTSINDANSAYYQFDDLRLEVDDTAVNNAQRFQPRYDSTQGALLNFGEFGTYQLFNLQGSLLSAGELDPSFTTIDLNHLAQGVYVLTAKGTSRTTTFKLWKE